MYRVSDNVSNVARCRQRQAGAQNDGLTTAAAAKPSAVLNRMRLCQLVLRGVNNPTYAYTLSEHMIQQQDLAFGACRATR